MRKVFFALVILLTPELYAQQGCEKNFIDQNYIEVTGKAEMKIIPDMIYLSIVINENDVKKSVELKEYQMIKVLQELGIDVVKNLKVGDLDSDFKSKIFKKDIVKSKTYQLLVNDAETAANVVAKLEEIDISNISVAKVDHSKIEQFRREVKVNATKVAKEKASDLAQAVGQNIGRALYIQELNNYQNYARTSNAILAYGATNKSLSDDVPLQFQDINIEYSVLCRFELK